MIKGSKVNQSTKVASLCRPGPLCPIRVWLTLAASVDSWGMMRGNKWTLKAELGQNDEHHGPDDFAAAIEEAINAGLVSRWWNKGIPWLYVVGHDEEHKVKYRSKYPASPRPPLEILNQGGDLGDIKSLQDRSKIDLRSDLDRSKIDPRSATGKGKGETGKGKRERGKDNTPPAQKPRVPTQKDLDLLLAERIPEQLARDYLELRRKRRAPITKTALNGIRREAKKAGITLEQAIETCCANGWQGFRASWGIDRSTSQGNSQNLAVLQKYLQEEKDGE